jgi:hypothetical protein
MASGSGCSSYKAPVVTVASARVTDRSDEATRLDVDLAVDNPNRDELLLEEFTYTVSVDGRTAYHGRRSADLTLGAGREQWTTLPAIVTAKHLAGGTGENPVRWSISGELLYVAPGEIAELLLDTGVRRPKVRFQHRGTVDVRTALP